MKTLYIFTLCSLLHVLNAATTSFFKVGTTLLSRHAVDKNSFDSTLSVLCNSFTELMKRVITMRMKKHSKSEIEEQVLQFELESNKLLQSMQFHPKHSEAAHFLLKSWLNIDCITLNLQLFTAREPLSGNASTDLLQVLREATAFLEYFKLVEFNVSTGRQMVWVAVSHIRWVNLTVHFATVSGLTVDERGLLRLLKEYNEEAEWTLRTIAARLVACLDLPDVFYHKYVLRVIERYQRTIGHRTLTREDLEFLYRCDDEIAFETAKQMIQDRVQLRPKILEEVTVYSTVSSDFLTTFAENTPFSLPTALFKIPNHFSPRLQLELSSTLYCTATATLQPISIFMFKEYVRREMAKQPNQKIEDDFDEEVLCLMGEAKLALHSLHNGSVITVDSIVKRLYCGNLLATSIYSLHWHCLQFHSNAMTKYPSYADGDPSKTVERGYFDRAVDELFVLASRHSDDDRPLFKAYLKTLSSVVCHAVLLQTIDANTINCTFHSI